MNPRFRLSDLFTACGSRTAEFCRRAPVEQHRPALAVLNLNRITRPPCPPLVHAGDVDLFRLAQGLQPRCRPCSRRSVKNAEVLAEFCTVDLAGLHLVQEVEGGVLGRRPADHGDVGRFRFLVVLEQQAEDGGMKRIGGEMLGVGQEDHGRPDAGDEGIGGQEAADRAAVVEHGLSPSWRTFRPQP